MRFDTTDVPFAPQRDITESDTEFVIRVDVPGIPKENVDVQLTGDALTNSGHREKVAEKKGETYLWREPQTGKFSDDGDAGKPPARAGLNRSSRPHRAV